MAEHPDPGHQSLWPPSSPARRPREAVRAHARVPAARGPGIGGLMDTTVSSTTGEQRTSSGVYVYSIIESAEPRTFGKIGIGGRGGGRVTLPLPAPSPRPGPAPVP